jgi:hypothetical protein
MLRTRNDQPSSWESILPQEVPHPTTLMKITIRAGAR